MGAAPDQEDRDLAAPFWRVERGRLVYAATERGKRVLRRETTSVPELLEWVMRDVTWSLAMEREMHARREGEDSRRQLFAIWIELAGGLEPVWGKHVRAYVDQVLQTAPYLDRPYDGGSAGT